MNNEKTRWAKLAGLPEQKEEKQQLDENFVGHQMVGNMFDREKEKYESSFEYFLSEKYEPTTESDSMDEEMEMGGEMETDKIDIVTMDVPLFIRVLEYSREDAQADMDLHELAEKAIAATKQQGILSMDDYNMLTGELEQIGEENEEK